MGEDYEQALRIAIAEFAGASDVQQFDLTEASNASAA